MNVRGLDPQISTIMKTLPGASMLNLFVLFQSPNSDVEEGEKGGRNWNR